MDIYNFIKRSLNQSKSSIQHNKKMRPTADFIILNPHSQSTYSHDSHQKNKEYKIVKYSDL